ncbi:autotransporter, partial [Polynucleobacter sp. 86C-FISCH]|nr:autotransporter [Polynucleobacter sp. 86C-FISCH]
MMSLGTLGGGFSTAMGVSANGSVIVGGSTDLANNQKAFKYTDSGGMVSLGTLAGGANSQARAASADGSVIVGYSDDSTGSYKAFKYTATGGMVSLGTFTGGTSSIAMGVSGDGSVIVGYADNASGQYHAFMYRNITSTPSSPGTTPPPLVDILNTYSAVAKQGYQLNSVL